MVFSKLGLLKWMDLLLLHSALLSQAIPSCKADLIPDLLVLSYAIPSDNFAVPGQSGTFWYHSHYSTQYCDGLR